MNLYPTKNRSRLGALLMAIGGLTGSLCAQTRLRRLPMRSHDAREIYRQRGSLEAQILPTVRPIGSVFGDDRSILDTPRSVTSVNKAWMDDRQIRNAMDFSQFSAGVYSAAQYGIPGVPQVRGDLAQIYINGQVIRSRAIVRR